MEIPPFSIHSFIELKVNYSAINLCMKWTKSIKYPIKVEYGKCLFQKFDYLFKQENTKTPQVKTSRSDTIGKRTVLVEYYLLTVSAFIFPIGINK